MAEGRSLTVDAEIAGHVAYALDGYIAHLRRMGRAELAGSLEGVCVSFAKVAMRGQSVGVGAVVVDNEAMSEPKYVSYSTAAAMLGCSSRTIRRRVREGAIPVSGPSKRSSLALADVLAYRRDLKSFDDVSDAGAESETAPVSETVEGTGARLSAPEPPPSNDIVTVLDPFKGASTVDELLTQMEARRWAGRGRNLDEAMANFDARNRGVREWWNSL